MSVFRKVDNLSPFPGSGYFGTSYSGTCNGLPVRVKYLALPEDHCKLSKSESYVETLGHLVGMQHSNIHEVLGLTCQPGRFGIIAPAFSGSTLDHILLHDDDKLPYIARLKLIMDISRAMAFLHLEVGSKRSIVHGNLKPSNVLLCNGLVAKVVDFGLCPSVFAISTQTRKRFQFLPYHAPELRSSIFDVTEKSDVYSFAILTYYMLTYTQPYAEVFDVAAFVCTGGRPNVQHLPREVPEFLNDVMQQCWSHDPAQRPPFILILDELEQFWTQSQYDVQVGAVAQAFERKLNLFSGSAADEAKELLACKSRQSNALVTPPSVNTAPQISSHSLHPNKSPVLNQLRFPASGDLAPPSAPKTSPEFISMTSHPELFATVASDRDLAVVARKLGDYWDRFVIEYLSISHRDVTSSLYGIPAAGNTWPAKNKCLQTWKRKGGSKATRGELVMQLQHAAAEGVVDRDTFEHFLTM